MTADPKVTLDELIAGHGNPENWGYNKDTVEALQDYKRLREALSEAGDALEAGAAEIECFIGDRSFTGAEWDQMRQQVSVLRALKEMGK